MIRQVMISECSTSTYQSEPPDIRLKTLEDLQFITANFYWYTNFVNLSHSSAHLVSRTSTYSDKFAQANAGVVEPE